MSRPELPENSSDAPESPYSDSIGYPVPLVKGASTLRECTRHSKTDYFGCGTTILRCAHLDDRFVIAVQGRLGGYYVDYVENADYSDVYVVEGHFCSEEWQPMFDDLETRMLAGVSPDRDRE